MIDTSSEAINRRDNSGSTHIFDSSHHFYEEEVFLVACENGSPLLHSPL